MLAVGAVVLIILTVAFSPKRLLGPGLVAAIGVSAFSASTEAILALVGAYLVSWVVAGLMADE